MSDLTPPLRFEPGEVAVLTSDSGPGRLFIVDECRQHWVRVGHEYYWQVFEKLEHDWQREHWVHQNHLVKVDNRDRAIALVAVLGYIHEQGADAHRKVTDETRKAKRAAIERWKKDEVDDEVE